MAEAKSLGDAIQKLIDNVETVAEIAGNISRLQAEKDFSDAAKTAVDKYYEYKSLKFYSDMYKNQDEIEMSIDYLNKFWFKKKRQNVYYNNEYWYEFCSVGRCIPQ